MEAGKILNINLLQAEDSTSLKTKVKSQYFNILSNGIYQKDRLLGGDIKSEVALICSLLYYSNSQNKDNSINQQPDYTLERSCRKLLSS